MITFKAPNPVISRRRFGAAIAGLACASLAAPVLSQASRSATTRSSRMQPGPEGTGEKIDGRYRNGECWLDEDGRRINAHGAGMLFHEGIYYWYGEARGWREMEINGKTQRVTGGVACWKSTDLLAWKHIGIVMATRDDDPQHDLHPTRVLERPKVIYNKGTKKVVLWLHVDTPNYGYARAGVAVSDSPEGPFRYIESFRPNGFMSRDQTVFIDREGQGYHIGSSDENATAMITLLSDDYLRPSGNFVKVFDKRWMEAFAFCERDGKYWMIASGCTGWKPNKARQAVAESFMGPWHELPNPCVGKGSELTFEGQSCYIQPPGPANADYIAMFDIWRPHDLRTSGYMWLPIQWQDGRMVIHHELTWPPRQV